MMLHVRQMKGLVNPRLPYQPALCGIWNRCSLPRSAYMCAYVPCSRLLAGETHVHIKRFHWSSWYDWRWKNRAALVLLLRVVLATIFIESAHVIIETLCQANTAAYCKDDNSRYHWFGCRCDIKSIFNTKSFTRFCKRLQNKNNEQERKGRRRAEEWLIAGHQTKWEPETVRCQNCYRFILYLLPWDLPHIHPLWAEQKRGERCEKVWAQSQRSNSAREFSKRGLQKWVRDGGRESEEGWVWGENSNISWVLFRSTFCTLKGALYAWLYICPPHVGLQWVGCPVLPSPSPHTALYLSRVQDWSDNSVYTETEMVYSFWFFQKDKIMILFRIVFRNKREALWYLYRVSQKICVN